MLTNTERQQIVEEVNAGTYGIDEALDDIAAAQKGEEVRKALYAEALVLNREGHAGSTDMIARQKIANLQTSVNGQISTLRTEVGDDIDDLETALNNGLATQNGKIAAQNASIANVVKNYNLEYGSETLWKATGETGALAAGTTVTLSEDVSHFDYVDIYSFCGNSNVLDTVPVDAKLQSSQGYALRWVNLSDPDSGSYKAYVRIIETRLHIIGTTLTIDHQVTYRNGEEVNISGAEITQSNRSTYMGELGIMKIVGRKITANTEIEDVRIGANGTKYASAGQAVRAQVTALESAIPAVDSTLSTQGAAADAKVAGGKVAELKSALNDVIAKTYDNLREVPVTFIDGGYIDRNTGDVAEYSGWKYSDYIDLSGLTNSYFIALLTTTEISGSSYNTFYNANKEKIGNYFSSGINTLFQVPLYEDAKYIRVSCRAADKYQIFDDTEKAPIDFYRDDNVLISDFLPVNGIKYMLSTPINTSIEQFDTGKNSIAISPYAGSREYYKGNNVAYIQLRFTYANYTNENVKAITFEAKDHFEPINNFRVCTFNVGLWNNGVTKQPDATMQEYAQNFRRFLGKINSELICCLEAPTTGNISETYDVNIIFDFLYGYRRRFETGDSTGKIVYGKNTFLNPTEHTFAASGRKYYSFQYNVGSELITVYLVHLSIEASTEGNRKQDLQEIAGILASTPHCIVLGDWNTYDMSELDVLSAYNIANGGIFGKFVTWPKVTETWPNGAIDNIVTTTDIAIKNVFAPDVTLSDHKPLVADISLY